MDMDTVNDDFQTWNHRSYTQALKHMSLRGSLAHPVLILYGNRHYNFVLTLKTFVHHIQKVYILKNSFCFTRSIGILELKNVPVARVLDKDGKSPLPIPLK